MKSGSIFSKVCWIIFHQGPMEFLKRALCYLGKHSLRELWVYRGRTKAYSLWLKKESERIKEKVNSAPQEIAGFSYRPLISIVMPVWNTQAAYLEKTIESVLNQAYQLWELCIANDASSEPHLLKVLNKYQEKDTRLKIISLSDRGSIVKASNAALGLATGEFVGFLDPEDVLAPHALLEFVKLLNEEPDINIVYSDEDRLIEEDTRVEPFFKPDWSPHLLLSMNYIGYFIVVRRQLVEELDILMKDINESWNYDFLLLLSERTTRIAHLPEILYHRRITTPGLVSDLTESKAKNSNNDVGVLKAAIKRRGIKGNVVQTGTGCYRVKYHIHGEPLVSIIIPTRDNVDLLRRCMNSIRDKSTYHNYEIIVVDNGSIKMETKSYFQEIMQLENCRVACFSQKFNYSKINNFASRQAAGDYLLFLNNDTEVITSDWIEEMLSYCQRPEIGAIGVKLLFPDNSIQHGGIVVGMKGVAGHVLYGHLDGTSGYKDLDKVIRNCSAVTAACLMMRKNVFEEVDGFDEELDVAYNDVDLCLKVIEKGYFIVWTPHAVLYHYESASRGQYQPDSNIQYFRRKWKKFFDLGDPFYNPNLALNYSDFRINV